jgi:hypothetical protein
MCTSFSHKSEQSQIYYQGLSILVDILVDTLHNITQVLKTLAASQRMIISNCLVPKLTGGPTAVHLISGALHTAAKLNWRVNY